jgi:DNA-binding NarL/FixJ family response regulator
MAALAYDLRPFVLEAPVSGGERYGNRIPTEREWRVIELVAQGCKNTEVAEAIGTTEHVVKTRRVKLTAQR